MSSSTLFFLLSTSFLVLIAKKTRIAVLLSFLALLWFVFIGFGFLPELLLTELQTAPRVNTPEWKRNNLIILLGGGKSPWESKNVFSTRPMVTARVLEAARLYYSCKKTPGICQLAISGGDPSRDNISEAQVMARELSEIGINPADIVLEDKSNNTYQNAKFVASVIKPDKIEQIYLVTSGFHMQRSLILFSHFGIRATAAPADRLDVRGRKLAASAQNFFYADISLHEFGGILQFYLYNWLGWNS